MNRIGFLFDLDGVLIDSESEYTRIWSRIDEEFPTGIKNFPLIIKGQTLSKILSENYSDDHTRDMVKKRLHELEGEMGYDYCKGAEKLLDDIRKRGHGIALVTSSDEKKMAHLYKEIPGIRNKLDEVIDASKVKKSKPDPEGYLKGAQAVGKDIRQCVVIEDSVQGVKAGKAAGAYVIGVTGTKKREDLLPYSDMVIDSLEEINLDRLELQWEATIYR